jgi:mRNA interferase RelE/StbE
MKVVLERKAAKYLESLDAVMKRRINEAVENLAADPPSGDIVKLQGKDGYRLRIGDYRVVFDITETEITVYKIAPRGQAYKRS